MTMATVTCKETIEKYKERSFLRTRTLKQSRETNVEKHSRRETEMHVHNNILFVIVDRISKPSQHALGVEASRFVWMSRRLPVKE